jgi:hypothetical protein
MRSVVKRIQPDSDAIDVRVNRFSDKRVAARSETRNTSHRVVVDHEMQNTRLRESP